MVGPEMLAMPLPVTEGEQDGPFMTFLIVLGIVIAILAVAAWYGFRGLMSRGYNLLGRLLGTESFHAHIRGGKL